MMFYGAVIVVSSSPGSVHVPVRLVLMHNSTCSDNLRENNRLGPRGPIMHLARPSVDSPFLACGLLGQKKCVEKKEKKSCIRFPLQE